jgi:hypothetical protein
MAAFSVGTEIIQLRHTCHRLDLSADLDGALDAVGRGNCAMATAKIAALDAALTSSSNTAALRARSHVLALSQALTQHSSYFEAGAPG